jgi:hypothetical protein
LVGAAILAGCAHQDPLVGAWAGTQTSPRGIPLQETWTFTADSRLTTTMQASGGVLAGRTLTAVGTYTAADGTMTQTIDSMSEPGRTRTIANPVASTYQYTLNGDTLTITLPGIPAPLVLTRQASP